MLATCIPPKGQENKHKEDEWWRYFYRRTTIIFRLHRYLNPHNFRITDCQIISSVWSNKILAEPPQMITTNKRPQIVAFLFLSTRHIRLPTTKSSNIFSSLNTVGFTDKTTDHTTVGYFHLPNSQRRRDTINETSKLICRH